MTEQLSKARAALYEKTILDILNQVAGVVIGKNTVVVKMLMSFLAGGHVLLEDIPGVGKTTLAMAFARSMDLVANRVQFTPDVMPSDITGFTVYNKKTEQFEYKPGAAFCNLFLADEINRTSSKTQSALLELMEEGQVTVDAVTRAVPDPFIVIATQNPVGTVGTQMLPESQMDRFMIRMSMGYPSKESEAKILQNKALGDPLSGVKKIVGADEVLSMRQTVKGVFVDGKIFSYIVDLVNKTRRCPHLTLGASPRGSIAVLRMARACALLNGRNYVIPDDVQYVFADCICHRLILTAKARVAGQSAEKLVEDFLRETPVPSMK